MPSFAKQMQNEKHKKNTEKGFKIFSEYQFGLN